MDIVEPVMTTEGDFGHYYTYVCILQFSQNLVTIAIFRDFQEFTFESCHACPNGCDGKGGGGGGTATGLVGILLMLL